MPYLKKHINNFKKEILSTKFKPWLDLEAIYAHIENDSVPSRKIEEWKFFNTLTLAKTNWSIGDPDKLKSRELPNAFKLNTLNIKNGFLNIDTDVVNVERGIKVSNIEDYLQKNPTLKNKIYSSPENYADNKISGKTDNKATKLMSLNSLFSKGIVIEIGENIKITKQLSIKNIIGYTKDNPMFNPYVIIVCKKNSTLNLLEIFDIEDRTSWVNSFFEVFLEEGSKLDFVRINSSTIKSLKTSSTNFHQDKNSSLSFIVLNKENAKDDIRVYLNEENARAKINGIIVSSKKQDSNIFCRIEHNYKNTKSDQKWKLLSFDRSRTSVYGKIRVEKGAKKTEANFSSKSLILSDNASSNSKPELEILEDDVKCSHGASFGEIDKDKIFFMGSRGIERNEAIKLLVYAFFEDIEITEENKTVLIKKELDKYFI